MVDADLRHPKMHTYFNLHPEFGLSDYLTKDVPISDMLINPQDIPHFVMLPGGNALSNSSEMLSSPKMSQLVDELKNRYPSRIVIFDLPPLLSVADAIAFSPYVDAALLVIEDGETTEDDVKSSLELLGATNVIGTVLNKAHITEEDKARIPGWFSIIKDLFRSGFSNRRLLEK
jgi:Mrp family chromosome partitioning ATPase